MLPAIIMVIQLVISVVELIVVSIRFSLYDLCVVGVTVDLCECVGKSLIFVVNVVTFKAKIMSEVLLFSNQHNHIKSILPVDNLFLLFSFFVEH